MALILTPLGRLLVALIVAAALVVLGRQDRRIWVLALAVLAAGVVQAAPWALGELGFQLDLGRGRWSRLMGEAEEAVERGDAGAARSRLEAALADAGAQRPVLAAEAADRLADLAIAEGRYAEAARWLERELRSRERVPGADDPRTCATRGRLVEVFVRLGEHERAIALMRQQVERVGRREGAESAPAAAAGTRLATLLAAWGGDEEAEACFRDALAHLERLNGPHHWSLVEPLRGLAAIEARRGRPAQSETLLRRALDCASVAGRTELTNRVRSALVDLYVAVGRPAEAVSLSEARLRSLEAGGQEDPSRTADMLDRHAHLLERAGDDAGARRYRRRAELLRAAVARGGASS